jgi:hypothetical protein
MHIPKNYFHDRIVLLVLSVNTFLALLITVTTLLRLVGTTEDYIVQYRANLGLGAFTTGTYTAFIYFVFFSLFVLVFHILLSMKVYHLRRHFSVAVLAMGTLLLLLVVIVSNALLLLR